MRILKNTLISKRIKLLTLVVVISFIATAGALIANEVARSKISEAKRSSVELSAKTTELNHFVFEAQNVASSFFATHDPEFELAFVTFMAKLNQQISFFLKYDLVTNHSLLQESAEDALVKIQAYEGNMKKLFAKWEKLGVNEELGLHGEIRDEAHAIEAILESLERESEIGLKSRVLLLSIRRAEKDYIQRLDSKYVSLVRLNIAELIQLSQSNFNASTNQAIQSHLLKYNEAFDAFVSGRAEIQKDEQMMREQAFEVVKAVEVLRQIAINRIAVYDREINDLSSFYSYIVFGTVLITGIIVIGIAGQVSKSIIDPLKELTQIMQSFLRNDYSISVTKFPKDTEFGDISEVLVKMKEQEEARVSSEQKLKLAYGSLDDRVKERTKELEKANEELNQFAYVISHDIKAPLRAIHNYSDFLLEDLEGKLEEEQEGYLKSMAKAVAEGEQMIEDVLTLSRMGRTATEIQVVDIDEILSAVKTMLAPGSDCELVCSGKWPPVPTNATLLKQVLSNLIGNGFKFNKSDYKKVEITGGEITRDDVKENQVTPSDGLGGRYVEICVHDNGIGIDEQYRENIFKIFHRLHNKKEYEGTGIGLAIVKKAMTELRGTISVDSTELGGTCFVLSLPLELDMKGEI
ncbi:sensor histidine kinase [Kiloniella litopenaei]|uniref:sensor histidine kinase n=1 Tax=Kiloniella litopenaei TaxID=1549748 RepID=UPI003BAB2037